MTLHLDKPIQIRIIFSVCNSQFRKLEDLKPFEVPGLTISLAIPEFGPDSGIESTFDQSLAIPGIVKRAMEAEQEGVDGVVIENLADTGLIAAREKVSIPIVGMAQTAIHMASILGNRFGFIVALDKQYMIIDRLIQTYGFSQKMAPTRAINIRPKDARNDIAHTKNLLIDQAIKLIKENGVDTIILGCSNFLGQAKSIEESLRERGYGDITVLDPVPISIIFAKYLVEANLVHNRKVYPFANITGNYIGFDAFKK